MEKGNSQKMANGSALDFEAQLWAAAEQAVPAPHLKMPEYNGARPEGFSDPKSEWFKDEPRDYARPSLDTATRGSANLICESHRRDFRGEEDHVRLSALRDALLPKLLSGELRVPAAVKLVEAT
jgi:hypothetical protein